MDREKAHSFNNGINSRGLKLLGLLNNNTVVCFKPILDYIKLKQGKSKKGHEEFAQ